MGAVASEQQRAQWREQKRAYRAKSAEARARDRQYALERSRAARAAGLCSSCGVRPSNGYSKCKRCYAFNARLQEQKMSGATQDLSQYPVFARGERDGLRYFSGWLPWPAWQKATRTAHTPRPGFRPLVKSAKLYQQFIAQAVLVNGFPELPWLRPGSEWELDFISFNHKSDNDQHSWGLQDDFVKSGLLSDDKHCACTHSRRVRIATTEEQRIFIAGYETVVPERQESNG